MPRSAPGPRTSRPSRSTRPAVGRSRPATMRRSVDFPQPDGPRMAMKSFSASVSVVGSRARTGAAPRTPGKTRDTPWTCSLAGAAGRVPRGASRGPAGDAPARSREPPWKEALVDGLEREVRDEPDHADDDDPEDDLPRGEQRLALDDHVADARRGSDHLRHDDVGPGPAEHEAQDLGDIRRRRRDEDTAHDAAVARSQRIGRLDEVAPGLADRDRHHQHDLEDGADEDDEELLHLPDAGPEDEKRHEGGGRQVAGERNEGFEEGLDRLVGAHQDAE